MPELPEVERAARRIRRAVVGQTIVRVVLIHPAFKRRIAPRALASLRNHRVAAVTQRAKHQLLVLDDGRALHVHFRMAGDWSIDQVGNALPRTARAAIEFVGGKRLLLIDPRALSAVALIAKGESPFDALGPDPSSSEFNDTFAAALARRSGPVKPALLDQRIAAGVGNLYAAEALWEARIHPAAPADSIPAAQVEQLAESIRTVLDRGRLSRKRYREGVASLRVYDREDEPCPRCGTPIARMTQAGRSTWYCPECQALPGKQRRKRRTGKR